MQKKAVILHGTANDHTGNWFPWLKTELEKIGYEVWVPDLPDSEHPDAERYNDFLLASGWDFNNNLIVGHSSGAVEILALLSVLPKDAKINTAILIGSFAHPFDDDPNARRSGLFAKPFDYEYLKTKAKQFIFIHSDNDPYCPLEQAQYLHKKLAGEFVMIPGQKHFNLEASPDYKEFPKLLDLINQKVQI
jgi:hypothetical protein